jgi:hypothetical protein
LKVRARRVKTFGFAYFEGVLPGLDPKQSWAEFRWAVSGGRFPGSHLRFFIHFEGVTPEFVVTVAS